MNIAPCKGIRNILARAIRNPRLWNLEYSSKNPQSHQRLESRIQLPSTDSTGIQYLESVICLRLSWIPLH